MNAAAYAARRAAGLCTLCRKSGTRAAVRNGLCAYHYADRMVYEIRREACYLDRRRMLYPPDVLRAEPDPCNDPPDRLARGIARGYVEVDLEQMAD